jgi:hypothetical protein
MESIDKMIQVVEKLEQDSLMVNDNDSKTRINSIKDNALSILPIIRIKKDDPKNLGHSKVLDKLEEKIIKTISRLERLLK